MTNVHNNLSMFDARQLRAPQPARPSRIIELLNAEAANHNTATIEGVAGPERNHRLGRAAPGISALTPLFPPRDGLVAIPPQRPVSGTARTPTLPASATPPNHSRELTTRQPMTIARTLQPIIDYVQLLLSRLPAPLLRVGQVGLGLATALPKLAAGPFLGALSGVRRGLLIASFEADPDVGTIRGWNMLWFLPLTVGLNTAMGVKMGIRWGLDQVAAAVVGPFGAGVD